LRGETEKRTLVLVSDPHLENAVVSRLRSLSEAGATVIAWQHRPIVQDRFRSPEVMAGLSERGIPAVSLSEALSADFELDEAVITWMKDLGRKAFRGRFRWGPLDLWWWAEIYLYHETPLRLIVRDVEALARLVERGAPERLVLVHPVRALESAARRFVRDVEVLGKRVPGPPRPRRTDALFLLDFLKMWGTTAKSIFRGPPAPPVGKTGDSRVFFLTHASMWSDGREIYFHDILPAVASRAGDPVVVAFGPPVPFRKRGIAAWMRDLFEMGARARPYVAVRRYFSLRMGLRLTREFLNARRLFRELAASPEMVQALVHRGVPLGAEALASFRDTFLRQFPWAKRSFLEVEAVLLHERPKVLVLYAESSGLGRAAVAAARTHGIPSVAVQHGIMYPQYYSHEHAPDEVDELEGDPVPLPTRTAVFGELAKDLLMRRGSYPPDRIVVTGSPKFDALVQGAAAYDPVETRRALGISAGGRFLVLATRWSAIGEPVFEELVRAVESLEGIALFVKPHQAESPRPYEVVVERLEARQTRILPAERNLLELLVASDGLVTVDSLASSEALVLGRPVLILNLPGNLSPLVDREAALGVRRGESIAKALQSFLFDPETGRALAEKRKEYIQDFAFGADGRATERIVECILSEGRRVDA
jgi:hypothetical protein